MFFSSLKAELIIFHYSVKLCSETEKGEAMYLLLCFSVLDLFLFYNINTFTFK